MLRQTRRIIGGLMLAFATVLNTAGPAGADQLPNHHGEIVVENVWVTPAKEGGRSILHLRISNESHGSANLLGATTPVAANGRIVGRISDHETATLDSISIRSDSVLDLASDHLWIEFGPLTLAVEPGESIPIHLIFLRGHLPVEAHVHNADG